MKPKNYDENGGYGLFSVSDSVTDNPGCMLVLVGLVVKLIALGVVFGVIGAIIVMAIAM